MGKKNIGGAVLDDLKALPKKILKPYYKNGKLKVNSMANLQLNIISLVTKDAAQLPQTMMQIIVMH